MRIKEFDCPSCGASVKIRRGEQTLSCPYCDSTIIVPDKLSHAGIPEQKQTRAPFQPTVVFDAGSIHRSCSRTAISIAVSLLIGVAALVFYLMRSSEIKNMLQDPIAAFSGESTIPAVLEFGGTGMSAGYFQNPEHVCISSDGNIYIGEYESGKIQIFDSEGNYLEQLSIGKTDNLYLHSMALSRDDLLYLVYDSELYVHDAETGELLDSLQHPDGWGFDDVEVCDDGRVVASWYCNSDDIIKFSPDGSVDFLLREAISTQSGDSELDTDVTVDGAGNIFAYGSFNGSIFKFSSEGRFLNRFGSDGDRPGQFTSPLSFCIDQQGRLWVSDFRELIVFDNDGTYLDSFDIGMTVYDMVMGDGYQLYAITSDDTVVQLDLAKAIEDL